jgi:hypothetical protein
MVERNKNKGGKKLEGLYDLLASGGPSNSEDIRHKTFSYI